MSASLCLLIEMKFNFPEILSQRSSEGDKLSFVGLNEQGSWNINVMLTHNHSQEQEPGIPSDWSSALLCQETGSGLAVCLV